MSYRGMVELLRSTPALVSALDLKKIPHYTTVEGFANAGDLLGMVDQLIQELMLLVGGGEKPQVQELAADSTGLSATDASVYFNEKRRYRGPFVKVSVAVICGLILPAAMVVSWGRSSDLTQAPELITKAAQNVQARRLYADAGYDGETAHRLCREEFGIKSYIPPVPRTLDGTIRSKYRSMMGRLPKGYRRRSHAESFFSALKRTGGSNLRARSRRSLLHEAALRVLGYAIMR